MTMAVGNLGSNHVERPFAVNGMCVGFDSDWLERKFPVDTAGFAVHTSLTRKLKQGWYPNPEFGGETEFLQALEGPLEGSALQTNDLVVAADSVYGLPRPSSWRDTQRPPGVSFVTWRAERGMKGSAFHQLRVSHHQPSGGGLRTSMRVAVSAYGGVRAWLYGRGL